MTARIVKPVLIETGQIFPVGTKCEIEKMSKSGNAAHVRFVGYEKIVLLMTDYYTTE